MTYQQLVDGQLRSFDRAVQPHQNTLVMATHWGSCLSEKPIWLLPFRQKPLPLEPENQREFQLLPGSKSVSHQLFDVYDAVRIEREVVLDERQEEVLVERLYHSLRPEFGDVPSLSVITTVSRAYAKDGNFRGVLLIHTAKADGNSKVYQKEVKGAQPRQYLDEGTPLGLPTL